MTRPIIRDRKYLSPKEKFAVRARQGNACACGCGEQLENGVHYDHIRPLWDEGTNDLDNFQALKPHHHIVKSRKETKTRAKIARIQDKGGLLKKKKSRMDKAMEKIFAARDV